MSVATGGIAEQRRVEFRLGDPEIAHALDVCIVARELFARIGEQFENADERGVVAQQILLRDRLAQRHHLIALVPRDVVARPVTAIGLANLRAGLDGRLREAIDRLCVDRFRPFDALSSRRRISELPG